MRQLINWLACALVFAFVLTGLASGAVVAGAWATRNELTVTNCSGQEVRGLIVTAGGEAITFGDLGAGASARAPGFEVRCRLADGTEIHERWGT